MNLSNVPNLHWKSIENRKAFMSSVAEELDVKKPSDWGRVTIESIKSLGGGALLNRYYKNSLFHCLQSLYTGLVVIIRSS